MRLLSLGLLHIIDLRQRDGLALLLGVRPRLVAVGSILLQGMGAQDTGPVLAVWFGGAVSYLGVWVMTPKPLMY